MIFVLAIAALSATYILFTSNVLFAAFSLVITFVSIAIIYLYSQAEFVAVTQIMIYVGGIIVLIIFGVMLTQETIPFNKNVSVTSHNKFWAFIVSGSIFSLLIMAVLQINYNVFDRNVESSVKEIGKMLLTEYLLLFELAAILLLAVLIGAAIIASDKKQLN